MEKVEMEKLLSKINSSSHFKALGVKAKKNALKGKWRLNLSWADLSAIAGFNKEIFRDVYSYLSSYSHSGGLSALQIGQAISPQEQKGLSVILMQYGLILMSHFIKSYNSLFPETKKNLKSKPEMEGLLEKWNINWNEEQFLKPFSHNKSIEVK
jgi:hypothetical protein